MDSYNRKTYSRMWWNKITQSFRYIYFMKIQLNNQTAELREGIESSCRECPFNKYRQCPYFSDTVLDCYDKDWIIINPADIFTL